MPKSEKRRFIRHDSLFLLDYIVVDKQGNRGIYSMGRTLDVCVDGLQLEILNRFEEGTLLIITVGFEDNLIKLLGEVTYTRHKDGRYISGVAFRRITKKDRSVLVKYSEAFQLRKKILGKSGRMTGSL